MNILALDLGVHTGWATLDGPAIQSGTWNFSGGTSRDFDCRVAAFYYKLLALNAVRLGEPTFELVVFEDVEFQTFTYQTQLWASFRAAMWLACEVRFAISVGVPVGTLKKFATGHGNATKSMMAAWLVKRHPSDYCWPPASKGLWVARRSDGCMMDDNEIDARHLLDYAQKNSSMLLQKFDNGQ